MLKKWPSSKFDSHLLLFLTVLLPLISPLICAVNRELKIRNWTGILIGIGIGMIVSLSNYFGTVFMLNSVARWCIQRAEQKRVTYLVRFFWAFCFSLSFFWAFLSGILVLLLTALFSHTLKWYK
jgi:hypothetical protein